MQLVWWLSGSWCGGWVRRGHLGLGSSCDRIVESLVDSRSYPAIGLAEVEDVHHLTANAFDLGAKGPRGQGAKGPRGQGAKGAPPASWTQKRQHLCSLKTGWSLNRQEREWASLLSLGPSKTRRKVSLNRFSAGTRESLSEKDQRREQSFGISGLSFHLPRRVVRQPQPSKFALEIELVRGGKCRFERRRSIRLSHAAKTERRGSRYRAL